MVANLENFQITFMGMNDDIKLCIDIGGIVIQMTDSVKLLGVKIDLILNFKKHVQTICEKASNKARAFSRIAPRLEYEKYVMLYNSFLLLNFNYCSLIWMFSGKSSNNEIDRLHKRALKVLLDDYGSTFEELLQKRGEHIIHTRNIQILVLDVYKCQTSKNPSFLWNIFERRPTSYNLRI